MVTNPASIFLICICGLLNLGKPNTACGKLWIGCIAIISTGCVVTMIAGRCPPGIFLRLWDSIPYVPDPTSMYWAPYLKEMTVHLENGKDLVIKAPKVSAKNRYVKSVKLNGREYDKAYLTHQDICNGGELFFEMSSTPNKKRVFTEEQKPYSMTK